ncbi:MAG: site-specific tyrosine recombinase XerC [Undibacterium sp.]|nr:site-specific tyrosine recombinase XerC [Undibacterium sp.]
MAHRTLISPKPHIGDVRDPNSLYNHMRAYLQWREERQFRPQTVSRDEDNLRYFITWCDERGLARPQEITRPILERYQRYLFLYRKSDKHPLSVSTQRSRVTSISSYFTWLAKQNHVLYNPASDLDMPRMGQRLPKHILSIKEIETILALPDLGTGLGVRDKAMLETLYSTGMRRSELLHLSVFSLDYERGSVMIRQGKGNKDRLIPIGERALQWIAKYRDDVRGDLATSASGETLFLTQSGDMLTTGRLSGLVRDYIEKADINKTGSCHLFRHSMATMMLENGADIRFIQAMLGHVSIATTQLYTHVNIRKLKDIHNATHPGRVIAAEPHSHTSEHGSQKSASTALLNLLLQEAEHDSNDEQDD